MVLMLLTLIYMLMFPNPVPKMLNYHGFIRRNREWSYILGIKNGEQAGKLRGLS